MYCSYTKDIISFSAEEIIKLLVASKIFASITGSPPFGGNRTKVFVVKALGFRPDSGVYNTDDNVRLKA